MLTPKIFDKLEQTQRGAGGEIQLTDAIAALMEEQEVFGYEFEGTRYDAGTTMGWLQASVEIALTRPDLGTEFRAYLQASSSEPDPDPDGGPGVVGYDAAARHGGRRGRPEREGTIWPRSDRSWVVATA